MYYVLQRISDTLGSCALIEVERAAKLLRELTLGKTVVKVDSVEDAIVFTGATHEQFVGQSCPRVQLHHHSMYSFTKTQEIQGRRVTDVQRYGEYVVACARDVC